MEHIRIISSISFSLDEGKIYKVLDQRTWVDEKGNNHKSITVLDNEGDEFIIVNYDEAEYEFI